MRKKKRSFGAETYMLKKSVTKVYGVYQGKLNWRYRTNYRICVFVLELDMTLSNVWSGMEDRNPRPLLWMSGPFIVPFKKYWLFLLWSGLGRCQDAVNCIIHTIPLRSSVKLYLDEDWMTKIASQSTVSPFYFCWSNGVVPCLQHKVFGALESQGSAKLYWHSRV